MSVDSKIASSQVNHAFRPHIYSLRKIQDYRPDRVSDVDVLLNHVKYQRREPGVEVALVTPREDVGLRRIRSHPLVHRRLKRLVQPIFHVRLQRLHA